MKCPNCNHELKKIEVKLVGAKNKITSHHCSLCDHLEFDENTSINLFNELKDQPLKMKQKIVKLSQDRLGMYFNNDVVRCLNMKKGEEVLVSVPDKKHILLEFR